MEVYIHSDITEEEFQRVVVFFNNRYDLECHAFGAKVLSLHREEDGTIKMSGLPDGISAETRQAYEDYMTALITFAAQASRINHKAPAKGTSEKYAFRTWLNRIGLKGPLFKETRKILLANLKGSSTRAH